MGTEMATEWAGQLAQLAETLLEKVPDKDGFINIREILQVTMVEILHKICGELYR